MINLPIKCYDNGGETADRYSVIFMDQLSRKTKNGDLFWSLFMDHRPTHPQGVGMHSECLYPNDNLGEEIEFEDLPEACQKLVLSDLEG